jgi:hypothetical protein
MPGAPARLEQARDELLLEHAVQFARHARREEEPGACRYARAKPQAVPIGLSMNSAPSGSIACFLLLGGMVRPRLVKKCSMRASHSSSSTRPTPAACGRRFPG